MGDAGAGGTFSTLIRCKAGGALGEGRDSPGASVTRQFPVSEAVQSEETREFLRLMRPGHGR